jgi:cobalt-zinc-cadmium efflux system protein
MSLSAPSVEVPFRPASLLATALTLLLAFSVIEFGGSLFTGSLALLAAAAHMLSNVFWLGANLAMYPADPAHDTRARRERGRQIAAACAMILGILLAGAAAFLLFDAWRRFSHPQTIQGDWMLAFAAIATGINLIGLTILQESSEDGLALRDSTLELVCDLLVSVGTMGAAVAIMATGENQVDSIVSAILALFLSARAWGMLHEALLVLFGPGIHILDPAEIERELCELIGVVDVQDVCAWTIPNGGSVVGGRLLIDDVCRSHQVLLQAQQVLHAQFRVEHSSFRVEPVPCEPPLWLQR